MKQSTAKSAFSSVVPNVPRDDEAESVPVLKSALAMGRIPLAEMMLDAQKLEAALKAIVRKKKMAARRLAAGRFVKSISAA